MTWNLRGLSRTDVPRVVRYSEPVIAWLKVTLTVATIVFVVGKVIIVDRGHLSADVPVGLTIIDLRVPGRTIDSHQFAYCQNKITNEEICEVWDEVEHDNNNRVAGNNMISITTSYTISQQERICDVCKWRTTSEVMKRVAGAEKFNLEVEHIYQSPKFYQEWVDDHPFDSHQFNPWWGSHASLPGYIVDPTNVVQQRFTTGEPDYFSVETLLQSAGVNLQEPFLAANRSVKTLRDKGVVLFVTLAYHNRPLAHATQSDYEWFTLSSLFPSVDEIYYTYRTAKLPGATYSKSRILSSNSTHRAVRTDAAIHVSFVHTGDLLSLSTSLLIVTLTAAITLLQFSDQIVTAVASSYLAAKWGIDVIVWMPPNKNAK